MGLAALTLVAGPSVTPAAADTGLDWADRPTTGETAECGDVLFIGVRGSGEEWPYGPTVERVREVLVQQTASVPGDRPRATVREIALQYPATSPYTLTDVGMERLLFSDELPDNDYMRSVVTGRAELNRVLDESAARCPKERWVLVGFSQGAQVITETLAERPVDPQLAGVVLVGNPLHYPTQASAEYGTSEESSVGLVAAVHYLRETAQVARDDDDRIGLKAVIRNTLAMSEGDVVMPRMQRVADHHRMVLPEELAGRVVSICDTGDLICDAGPALARVMLGASTITQETDLARPVHQGYGEQLFVAATDDLVADLMANLPMPGPEQQPEPDTDVPVELIGGVAGGAVLLGVGAAAAAMRRRRGADDDETPDWELLNEQDAGAPEQDRISA